MATLRDFSATLAAQSYAGQALASYSDEELAALVNRTGGESTERAALVCGIPGVDRARVESLVPGVASIPGELPEFTGVDELAGVIDAWRALRCMGRSPQVSPQFESSVRMAVSENPLVALNAVDAGLLNRDRAVDPADLAALVADLDRTTAVDGCDEVAVAEANALASLGGALTDALGSCARTSVSVSRSSTLDSVRMAGVPPDQVAAILNASPDQVHEWTTLRESLLGDWERPVGFGTLEATRDAIELVILSDSEAPQWIGNGVQAAVDAYIAGELLPTDRQAGDLLYLCTLVLGRCPGGLEQQVANAVSGIGEDGVPAADAEVARMLDALAVADSEAPFGCAPELAREWVEEAPLTLVALTATEGDCVELSGYSEQQLARLALEALRENEPARSVAFLRMRKYLVPVVTDNEYRDAITEEWRKFTERLMSTDADGYLERARPISVELTRAAFINATD